MSKEYIAVDGVPIFADGVPIKVEFPTTEIVKVQFNNVFSGNLLRILNLTKNPKAVFGNTGSTNNNGITNFFVDVENPQNCYIEYYSSRYRYNGTTTFTTSWNEDNKQLSITTSNYFWDATVYYCYIIY